MSVVEVEGLGPILDLARAIGIVEGDHLDTTWFSNPAGHVGDMLRNPEQRDALLRAANQLIEKGTPPLDDEAGRRWIRVFEEGPLSVHVVIGVVGTATELGHGVRLRTSDPASETVVYVPLLRIPASGPVAIAFTDGSARITLQSEVTVDPVAPAPGETGLRAIRVAASVATNDTAPTLAVTLVGLQLPGQTAPADVGLSGTPDQLGEQAIRLLFGIIQGSVAGAIGDLAELLALVGVSDDANIPTLPVAEIIAEGAPAWQRWVEDILTSPAALDAWVDHVRRLVGHGAVVVPPASPNLPYRVNYALANGVTIGVTVLAARAADGAPVVELGLAASIGTAGPPPGALELTATLARITLGASPAIAGLPLLEMAARIGPRAIANPADRLLNLADPAPKVGSIRAGFSLGADRRVAFLLAAHDVQIGAHAYPVLDLTNTQTLAEVGGNLVSDLADTVFAQLGAAEQPVRVLSGLQAPAGQPGWPPALTTFPDLLADPIGAIVGYHARVLSTHRAGYAAVLDVLRGLIAPAGFVQPIGGTGTEADPWRLEVAAGIAAVVWTTAETIELGIAAEQSMVDIGGGCPRVTVRIVARIASVALNGSGGHAVPGVFGQVVFGARGGVPLRIGDTAAAIVADSAGVELRWDRDAGLQASVLVPGLRAVVDGEEVAVALPTLAADGSLNADVPWRALELLLGHIVNLLDTDWSQALTRTLGWIPGAASSRGRLALDALVHDPVGAVRAWAEARIQQGDLTEIARAIALAVTGPAAPGLLAGAYRGDGSPASPFAIPLSAASAGAARRLELQLWTAGATARAARALPGAEDLGAGVARAAAALQDAGAVSRTIADALVDRPDLTGGLQALAAFWAGGDGIVRADAAVLPGASVMVHEVDGVDHNALPSIDLGNLGGIGVDHLTIFVAGPLGPTSWRGIADDHVLDLRAAGLAPEAFDVGNVANTDGPWLVRLGSRADCAVPPADDGFVRQTARLARVVDAVASRAGADEGVTIIAHGSAGHAAAAAAGRPGVARLVTLGTPHGGIDLSALEVQPAAGALQLLAALTADDGDGAGQPDAVQRGLGLLGAAMTAYDAASAALADLVPPPTAPTIPVGVDVRCVRSRHDARVVTAAIGALAARALGRDADTAPAVFSEPSSALGAGLSLTIDPPAAPGELHVTVELSLAGTAFATGTRPGLRARIGIGRAGGWLAGGPDPLRPADVARHPSLRRADIEVDLSADGRGTAQLIFHEANALGVSRRLWLVNQGAVDTLLPEARVLVGRMASGLGPVPATGIVRQIADLFDALGLIDAATGVQTGQPIGLSVDGIRRLVVDPVGLFTDAASAAHAGRLANALAALAGAAAPAASAPTRVDLSLDGVTIGVDVAARTVHASATAIAFPTGLSIGGDVELRADGSLSRRLSLAFGDGATPNGRPILDLAADPALQAVLRWEGAGAALPPSITLWPAPDTAGLARLLVSTVPPAIVWAGLTFVRTLQPGAVALIDPMLRASGLLQGDPGNEHLVLPVALVNDPAHWLQHAAVLGDGAGAIDIQAVRALLDVFARMTGIPQPAGGGAWQLPFGMALAAGTSGGRPTVSFSLDNPVANTGLRVGGSIALALPTGASPASPAATLLLALPGAAAMTDAGRLAFVVDASGLSVRLILPATNTDVRLLPNGDGLTALGSAAAAAAVTYALPFVLDAITSVDPAHPARPAGVALASVGDALGLRVGGHFDAAEIQALAADPAPQLAQRLTRDLHVSLDALAALAAPALPANYAIARNADDLLFRYTGAGVPFEVRLTVPTGSASGARLSASTSGIQPFAGATLGASITVDGTGLVDAHASFAVSHANAIAVGPISLAPVAEIAIGTNPAGGARLAAGLAVDATRSARGVLRFGPPATFALEATGGPLADVLTRLVLPPTFDIALSLAPVTTLLNRPVLGGATIQQLLDGVVFAGGNFDPGLLDTTQLFTRLFRLAANVATRAPSIAVGPLTLGISGRNDGGDQVYGVSLSLAAGERFRLVDGDVTVDIEVDASWITSAGDEGLVIELLRLHAGAPAPFFGIAVRGIGVRVGKSGGPLLDTFIAVDSIALHGLIAVDPTGVIDGGGQLELGNFRIALGESGGDNKVAAGIMRDSASGAQKPEPAFSPALSVQRHGNGALQFNLRAGEGSGPWWITIQRAFGPVYIEQVGFGVTKTGDRVVAARVIVDGSISLLGLTVAVDDLAVGAQWPQAPNDPPLYDPAAWQVDLAGLAVSADLSAVLIAGGLSRSPGPLPDYVGMISIRFTVYAISAYGGYAVVTDAQGDFTSLFIFGAVVAPIGGPPAFFVTGIGAGIGINRRLLLPEDLNDFPDFPFLQALDRNADMSDPMAALAALRAYFPSARGAFWLAAGLSFNSFSLVDGIAVIAVAIGDGLEISLLGLARAGLPNPSAPLVQIELALVARFSSREAVLWIQAQLTDNSFLLTKDCRLTGGFAFVMWFAGDKAGEFVLTLGGYHPSFHRDGYPEVPRLGFVWNVAGYLVIKGESYFALTSEAIMVGTRFEASLTLGPLWAYLRLGADGIVYFDPFHFEVTAYAELGAGVTIDIDLGWFGHVRITVSVHLHADVKIEGPEFHGRATIDLDVTSATIAFGSTADRSTSVMAWPDFDQKYIRPGGADEMTVVPGRGTLPPSPETGGKAPTGGASDPYLVLPEFTLSITTTAATSMIEAGGPVPPGVAVSLAIGPMQVAAVRSILDISVLTPDGTNWVDRLDPKPVLGKFPKGVWGPQSQSEPKPVPKGDTVEAINGATLTSAANISVGTVPIKAHQVEIGPRLHLPFLLERAARAAAGAQPGVRALAAARPTEPDAVLDVAYRWRTRGPNGSTLAPLADATFRLERSAPPQLVALTFRLALEPPDRVTVKPKPPRPDRPPTDITAHAPSLHTLLTLPLPIVHAEIEARTSVGAAGARLPRVIPRRLADVAAAVDPRVPARLVLSASTATPHRETIVATGRAPKTRRAGAGGELRRHPGQVSWRARRLDEFSKALRDGGADLVAGEIAILTTTNGQFDIKKQRPTLAVDADLPARIVTLDTAGNVTLDLTATRTTIPLPTHTERIVVAAGGSSSGSRTAGWHAGSRLAQVGVRTLVGPGCTVLTAGVSTRRGGPRVATGLVVAADAVNGFSIVTTRLPAGVTAVAIVLESGARTEDDRGDVLELGLSGARRARGADGLARDPLVVAGRGRTIRVFAVEPDGADTPVDVTVASGEHVYLSGVIGARQDAASLAEALARRDLTTFVGDLVDPGAGKVRVRWVPQRQ